jgi:hypothetical protein
MGGSISLGRPDIVPFPLCLNPSSYGLRVFLDALEKVINPGGFGWGCCPGKSGGDDGNPGELVGWILAPQLIATIGDAPLG